MDFKNRLKGKVTQGLLECLLEDVRYRIVPLGIEEIIREVKSIDLERYIGLGLSPTLRSLPDFFVALPDFSKTFLVEVKYRKTWNDTVRKRLGEQMIEQVKQWGAIHLVLFLGEKARDSETPASYLGVSKLVLKDNVLQIAWRQLQGNVGQGLEGLDNLTWVEKYSPWELASWGSFQRFQDVFEGLSERWEASTITKAMNMVKTLSELEE